MNPRGGLNVVSVIGRKIKELRTHAGLTIAELAHKSGVSRSLIGGFERGDRLQPGKDTLMALAQALDVDPMYLLDDRSESVFNVYKTAGLELPDEIREWLASQNAFAWVQLSRAMDAEGITPETIEGLVKLIREAGGAKKEVE